MTTWYCQNSSSNINDANNWNDVAAGGGNVLTWASLAAGDILVANGKTGIAINVDFTCAKISNKAYSGTVAGQFTVTCASSDRTITASVEGQDSGTGATCLAATLHATNRLTITGDVIGGAVSGGNGMSIVTANGLLTVTGTVTGGTHASAVGIACSTNAAFMTLGSVVGSTGVGVSESASTSTTISVSGVVSSPSGALAAISTRGIVTMAAGSSIASNGNNWQFPISGSASTRIKWETTDTGMGITLYDASAGSHVLKVPQYPAANDVQLGSGTYDYGTYTPNFTVPTEANVRYGVGFGAAGTEFTGAIEMPNSSSPTGTQDATSDACVVSGKIYGSPQRTGSAAGGAGGLVTHGGMNGGLNG